MGLVANALYDIFNRTILSIPATILAGNALINYLLNAEITNSSENIAFRKGILYGSIAGLATSTAVLVTLGKGSLWLLISRITIATILAGLAGGRAGKQISQDILAEKEILNNEEII